MGSAHTVSRRALLRTTAGATAAASATGVAAAQGASEIDEYLSDADNYDEIVDETGSGTVTVQTGAQGNGGAFAFEPAAVQVDPGTTIQWEWTGEGGGHNVVDEEGAFDSGTPVAEAGVNFEHTFEEEGVFLYYCAPHKSLGMKGAVVVGALPEGGGGGGEAAAEVDPEHMGVPFQAHWVGIVTMLMMFVTLIFTFFLLKYGESSHASHGD
ncbi:halocyanin domain-containing protein [Halorientalis brevis]|uniref:Halocyanin domain-containing protein n=1 Tax=Halorientalis brevis TaxID=1126241 RepID=A0ABD6C8H3_9EURY|nr:halocyanin domain-containing protein [Halorientalis brevis]